MKIETGKLIYLGSAFTEPGKGIGILLWLIIVLFAVDREFEVLEMPALYLCFIIGSYFLFSRKYLELTDIEEGKFKIRIGLGKFSHGNERSLSKYKYGILKQVTWVKKVQQGIAGLSINEGTYKEKFLGLFLVSKEESIQTLLLRGSKSDIIELIKHFLLPSEVKVYNGGYKKGAELKL